MIMQETNPSKINLSVVCQDLSGASKTDIASAAVRVYSTATGSEVNALASTPLVQVGATNVWRYIWEPTGLADGNYIAEYTLTDNQGVTAVFTEDLMIGYLAASIATLTTTKNLTVTGKTITVR